MHPAQTSNLAQLLSQTARLFPQRPGLIQGEARWCWGEIEQRVAAMTAALRAMGLKKGDRLLVHSRNHRAMFESCWVAFRMGCVWVPTNFRLAPPEVAYLASSSGAVAMIAEDAFPAHVDAARAASPALQHVIAIGSPREGELAYEDLVAQHLRHAASSAATHEVVTHDDPLWLFYTSGTTGRPKAGILTHGQMAFVVTNHLADLIPGTDERDCSIAVAPLSHGAGIHALLNVARGAATVLLEGEKMDPAVVWALIERHRVSNLFTVPTIVKLLVEHPAVDEFDHSSLKFLIYAGAPMYRADQQLALRKLGPVLVQYFGLGEVTGCITVLPRHMHHADDDHPDANVGACGRPRTGMEVAVLDASGVPVLLGEIGEICCRGPAVFAGYHDNPEATAKALRGGWFHTGDLGRLDARGLLTITGRESDMYISGGSNVYPREVEEVLLTHPGVAEVAIVGLPDTKWGEIGAAVVVRRAGFESLDEANLLAHLEGRSARYRWPHRWHFWTELPKSGYGKILKREIKERLLTAEAP
ncbi:MAG: acyl-CoA synthetase [Rubrivivax sp.]|jgi:acyl-CoA synthetase (AMP-forming)/AMP-acid ligase II|nr:acyl-CoA synthetase [Rubrivivax sp.]